MKKFLPPAVCRLPPASARCYAVNWTKVSGSRQTIVEVALHLPAPNIEPPVGPAVQAGPVGLTLTGKGPAHFFVPAAKRPRYQFADPAPRRNGLRHPQFAFDHRLSRSHNH